MSVREKLVELLKTNACPSPFMCDPACRYLCFEDCFPERFADHLIAHGVTVQENVEISDELLKQLKNAPITICKEEPSIELVQEWISVKDRLPDLIPCNVGTAYSEAVIAWTSGRKAMIAVWDGIDWIAPFDYWEAWGEEITHWMPLPEPPKGE